MKNYILFFLLLSHFFSCNNSETFRFALLSDTHVSEFGSGTSDLRLAVKNVNSGDDIQFVLVAGDITDTNTGENLITAKRILDSLDVPYYIIPGNHDTKWSGSAGANFRALWGDDKFSFEFGGYQFIGFHQGPILRMDDGHIPRDVLNWLAIELKNLGREKPVILVMHYALNPSVDNWYECLEIIQDYDIRAIIHGHGHHNRFSHYQGIPAFMGRSTLRDGDPAGGYTVFSVRNDSLIAQEKSTGGSVSSPWAAISLASKPEILPVPDSLLPDFTLNTKFPNVRLNWVFSSDYTMTASPIFDESIVYVGDVSGTMYALSRDDGKSIWKSNNHGSIYGTAALSDTKLIFTSADSFIYCLDKSNGSLFWKIRTGAPLVSVPTIKEEVIFVGASDGIFRAIDARQGKIVWEYPNIGGYVETKPLLYRQLVVFGAWDSRLYALDRDTGTPLWIWEAPNRNPLYSPAACWPVAAHGKIFITAPDRYIRAIDIDNGTTIWQDNHWKFRETVGLSENKFFVFGRSMTDSVVAFDTQLSVARVVWAEDFSYGYDIAPSMPVEKNGTLFWGTKNGMLIACDAENGDLKWKYRYQNYLINTVTPISADQVIFSNIDGDVVSLGTESTF